MTTLTEGKHTAQFLVSEANAYRSRDAATVTVPANTTYEAGTILGQITATKKYVRHDSDASDGSENEAAILYDTLVNASESAVDNDATIINTDAEVRASDLTYEDGADAAAKTASNAALAALGIKVR